MPTIGKKLEQTRLARGLTVEDVAHRTRIHPGMILSIEADDFSRFPSVTYAKSFLRKYGDCLGLDLEEAMETLGEGLAFGGDPEWMAHVPAARPMSRRFPWLGRRGPRRAGEARAMPLFLNLILGGLMAALGIFYFLGYNAPTLEQAKEDIVRGLGLPISHAPISPAEPREEIERHPLRAEAARGQVLSLDEPPPISRLTPPEDPGATTESPALPAPNPAARKESPTDNEEAQDRPATPPPPSNPPSAPLRAVPVAASP